MKKILYFFCILLIPFALQAQTDGRDSTPNRNIEEDSAFSMIIDYIKDKLDSTENKVILGIMILGFFLLLRYPLIGLFMIIAPGTVYLLYLKLIAMIN